MSGSASYSAMIATVGPGPLPAMVARNAVGSPPTPRSTVAPLLLEELGEPGRRLLLLEAELGVGVDLVADLLELVGEPVHRLATDLGSSALGSVRSTLGGDVVRALAQALIGRSLARANSSFAASTRAGSASRSKVVRAMVLAAASMPARASGFTAASANSRVWMAMPVGAMPIMGWMVGMTWLTLPTSEEPRRSGIGAPSVRPAVVMLAAKRSSRAGSLHRLVDVVVLGHLERRAGGLGRALRAGDHALVEVPHRVDARRAHVEDGRRVLGDDVGGRAAVGDDAVDAAVGAHLLAQHG